MQVAPQSEGEEPFLYWIIAARASHWYERALTTRHLMKQWCFRRLKVRCDAQPLPLLLVRLRTATSFWLLACELALRGACVWLSWMPDVRFWRCSNVSTT